MNDESLASDSTPQPVGKVRAFLRQVEKRATEKEEQLRAALDEVARLQASSLQCHRELDECTDALDQLRTEYQTDLRGRGEKVVEMTAEFLGEKFAAQLEELRHQITSQYDERLRELQKTLAARDDTIEQAKERHAALQSEMKEANDEGEATLEALRYKHETRFAALAQEEKTARAQLAVQYDKINRQLDVALKEKDKLVMRANETIEILRKENDRVISSSESRIGQLHDTYELEKRQLEDKVENKENLLAKLTADIEQLEAIVSRSDNLQQVELFEQEREEIDAKLQQDERRIRKLASSLQIVREICDSSPAARSIIAGAKEDIDLETLFAGLDD